MPNSDVPNSEVTKTFADHLFDTFMPILPKKDLSHFTGRLVHAKLPEPLRLASLRAFAKAYSIDLNEAEKPLEKYRSVGDLFTRKLKPGARPQSSGFNHPCDSKVAQAGVITAGRLIQAKDIDYTVEGLLDDAARALHYNNGSFITYYLCPTDYHRVHVPDECGAVWLKSIPGALWPVNAWSVRSVQDLYAINERVAMEFETTHGERFLMVMVAATNVGNIKVAFDPKLKGGKLKSREEKTYRPSLPLAKGAEAGLFAMGSSVVLLMDSALSKRLALTQDKLAQLIDQSVKVGVNLG